MPREAIKLVSTGKTKQGKNTGTFVVTNKNKKLNAEKLKLKRFDPRAYNKETDKTGCHVVFQESGKP